MAEEAQELKERAEKMKIEHIAIIKQLGLDEKIEKIRIENLAIIEQ